MSHLLENYYDEEMWNTYIKTVRENYKVDWEEFTQKDEILTLLNNQIEMSMLVVGKIFHNPLEWLSTSMEQLDGLTPIECLGNTKTTKRLKVFLMSVPAD